MNYVLDILGCSAICMFELLGIMLIGILIQGIVYRTTKFSIYNFIRETIEKEM